MLFLLLPHSSSTGSSHRVRVQLLLPSAATPDTTAPFHPLLQLMTVFRSFEVASFKRPVRESSICTRQASYPVFHQDKHQMHGQYMSSPFLSSRWQVKFTGNILKSDSFSKNKLSSFFFFIIIIIIWTVVLEQSLNFHLSPFHLIDGEHDDKCVHGHFSAQRTH